MRLDSTTGLLRLETLVSVGPTVSQNVYNTTLLRMEDVPGLLSAGLKCVAGLADGLNSQSPSSIERSIVAVLSAAEVRDTLDSNAPACTVQSVIMTQSGFVGQYGVTPRVSETLDGSYSLPVAAGNSSGSRRLSAGSGGVLSSTVQHLLGPRTRVPQLLTGARLAVPLSVMAKLGDEAWLDATPAVAPDSHVHRRSLQTTADAASVTSSPLVGNPLMCIRLGDSVMWDLRGGDASYPAYLKDSLLNTNPNFDYGQFRRLATAMKSTANVTAFGFSFTEPGTYVFGNAGNLNQRLIVTVMESGTSCPTEGPIVPMRVEAVNQVGTRRNDQVFLELNRAVALSMALAFLFLVLVLVAGFAYFHTLPWEESNLGRVTYRDKGKTGSLLSLQKHTAAAAAAAEADAKPAAAAKAADAGPGADSKATPAAGVAFASQESDANSIDDDDAIVTVTESNLGALTGDITVKPLEKDPEWLNVAEALMERRSGLVGDLTKMGVDDLDLVNVLETLETHQDAMTVGFLDQGRQTRQTQKSIHSEADSIKRLLATAAYERSMRDALYTPEDEAVRAAAAKRVMRELKQKDSFQSALANAQSRLTATMFELMSKLQPGAVPLTEQAVKELRRDEVQLRDLTAASELVVDLSPNSVIGSIRDSVMALQSAVDQCAQLAGEDRERASSGAPVWRLVSALGLGNSRAVNNALEGSRAGEEALSETRRRMMEALEPFADTAPGAQTELHATAAEFGQMLANTDKVPSVADLFHIRARRERVATAVASAQGVAHTPGQDRSPATREASDESLDLEASNPLGDNVDGHVQSALKREGSSETDGGSSHSSLDSNLNQHNAVEESELIDRSEVQWLDKEAYVQKVDSAVARCSGRLRTLFTDLGHVMSMLHAQVPPLAAESGSALDVVTRHQQTLGGELASFVAAQQAEDANVDEEEAALGDDDLLKYMEQLGHVLHGRVVLADGTIASAEGVMPAGTPSGKHAPDEHEADLSGAKHLHDELKLDDDDIVTVNTEEDLHLEASGRSGAAHGSEAGGSTHNAGMAAVTAAMAKDLDRDTQRREKVVMDAVAEVDKRNGGDADQQRAALEEAAEEDAAALGDAIGLSAAEREKLAASAKGDADAIAKAVAEEGQRAREDMAINLQQQRAARAEAKLRDAQAGVVAEMENAVAEEATIKASEVAQEQAAADEEYKNEQADMQAAVEKKKLAIAAQREAKLVELRAQLQAAQRAAEAGQSNAEELATEAAAAEAELEAAIEREAQLAEAQAAVQEGIHAASTELEAAREAHQTAVEQTEQEFQQRRVREVAELEAALTQERDTAVAELEAKNAAELEAATTAVERETLARGHAEERARLEAELAEQETRRKSQLENRIKEASTDMEAKRSRLMQEHEATVQRLAEKQQQERGHQQAKLRRRLEERKAKRAAARAKKVADELADAERRAQEAEARGDASGAKLIRATVAAAHASSSAAFSKSDKDSEEALQAASAAEENAMKTTFTQEAKLASLRGKARADIARVNTAVEAARDAGEREMAERQREKLQRKQAMLDARVEAETNAAGEDAAKVKQVQQKAREAMAEYRNQLAEEQKHERDVLKAKMLAAEKEASAKVALIQSQADEQEKALRLQWSKDIDAAMTGVKSQAERKAAAATDRLRDRRLERLQSIMAKAEAQKAAIEDARRKQAAALEAKLDAQAKHAHEWEADLMSKVASASGGAVGHSGRGMVMDAASAAERAKLEAEAESERLELAREQAQQRAAAEAAAEEDAARARQDAARAAVEEQQRLIAAKRAEQDAKRAAMGDVTQEELQRIKAEQEAEMAEYTAAMASNREEQDRKLNARLEARRARKRKALERQQATQRAAADSTKARALAGVEAAAARQRETEALKAVLTEGGVSADRKADAIETVLGERHAVETAQLLAEQYEERQNRKKALLEGLYEEKRGEMAELMDDLKRQGADDAAVAEAEDKFNQRWSTQIATAEASLAAEVEGKHNSEQISLRQRQLAEVSEAFSALAPEDILRRHEMEEAAKEAQELAAFQAEMESEKQRRMAALKAAQAEAEAQWRSEQEAEMRKLEEEHQRMLRQQEAAAERQRLMREERARKEDEAARAAAESEASGVSEEERERIMAAFRADAAARAAKMSEQRDKQQAAVQARLAKRKAARERKLASEMEAKRLGLAAEQQKQMQGTVQAVQGSMSRTMSNLAQRAIRRSMASMARMVPPSGRRASFAGKGALGAAGVRLASHGSAREMGGRSGSRLQAAASMRQAPGAPTLAARFAAAQLDVGELQNRVDMLENALSAIASNPSALFTPGAVPIMGGAPGAPPGDGPVPALNLPSSPARQQGQRSLASGRSEAESILSVMPEEIATAVMSVGRGQQDYTPAATDGVLQAEDMRNLTHRRAQHLRFARSLVSLLGMDESAAGSSGIRVLPARSFPRELSAANCFRGDFYWDSTSQPHNLYIRSGALEKISVLYSHLNHLLAVLRVSPADLSQDHSPDVIAALNKNLLVCGQQLFQSMAKASGGDFEGFVSASSANQAAALLPRSPARPPVTGSRAAAGAASARSMAGEEKGGEFAPETMADRMDK